MCGNYAAYAMKYEDDTFLVGTELFTNRDNVTKLSA